MALKKSTLFLRASVSLPVILIVLLGLKVIEPNAFWWGAIIGSMVVSVFIFVYNLLRDPYVEE